MADLQERLAQRTRERDEAVQQQVATAEALNVISRSSFDLQIVLDKLTQTAAQLCNADMAGITRERDGAYYYAAVYNYPPELHEFIRSARHERTRGSVTGRVFLDRKTIHVSDVMRDPEYTMREFAQKAGFRTALGVPLLREGNVIGVIILTRSKALPFTNKQIDLVKTFADQAVIAIENARLLNELRQRTNDLTDSLARQTATSEVLQVISSSTFDLNKVFGTLLETAMRLCESTIAAIWLADGDHLKVAAARAPSDFVEFATKYPVKRSRGTVTGRTALEGKTLHVPDVLADPEYTASDYQSRGQYRSALGVPLLREGETIGVFTLTRSEARPFNTAQIELVQNFAAQAVVAIENMRLLNELRESLQQQTATADVLKTISRSTFDLRLVLQTLTESAARLCEADMACIVRPEGDSVIFSSNYRFPQAFVDLVTATPLKASRGNVAGRVLVEGRAVHIPDVLVDPEYHFRDGQKVATFRSILGIPLLRAGTTIGVIVLTRLQVRPFTDKQIELVTTFADQAVIAIENVRLFEAEQQRTRELTESLEQQTATADVLRIISSSPGELEPVFQAMLDSATRICEAKFGTLFLCEGDAFRVVATNLPPALAELRRRDPVVRPGPGSSLVRSAETRQVVQIADMKGDKGYAELREPLRVALVEIGGIGSVLSVPMLKENALIGVFNVYREKVGLFSDKHVALVKNFASQAVIAIENARLLNELRQRTTDLSESLEQQTATAEVLRVISGSPTNVQPVFDSIAESAVRLCDGQFSFVCRFDGKVMDFGSSYGLSVEGLDAFRRFFPHAANEDSASGRAILRRAPVEIPDVEADRAYGAQEIAQTNIYRSIVAVPLLHEGIPIGTISVARANAGAFPERQIALLKAFADQAVIAIRNVRLFDEVQARTEELSESLQQQTATADVLKVISRSTFDLRPVLQTLVESAARFCAADNATVIREKDGLFYTAEAYGYSRRFLEYIRNTPIKAERGSASGRALVEGRVVHIPDVKADPEYTFVEATRLGDFRTALCVPMLREDVPIGVLTLTRSEVKPFTEKQIELVTTFADQAAIAIENVRLFDEIQDKSRQLEEASQHKSQFLANMSHELRTPLNAILGYTELMADGAYGEPSEKMMGILKRLEANGKHLLGLINDVLDLSKIEAGQLVLELSDYCVQDIAHTVRSTLEPLAADKKLAFKLELARDLPPGHGDGRRLTQVLINLVGNAIKFTDAGEVAIKAEANNGSFHVSVRDTGPGISAADQAKLFQEFQQADNAITRKKGGTGLGLAISKRIIEMHGGRIWVESQPGQGSTFTFTLPVVVEQQVNVEPK